MAAWRFFIFILALGLSGAIEAGVECRPVAAAKREYYDDPCEGISDGAEACFDDLNAELAEVEKGKASPKEIDALSADYAKAVTILRDVYTAELGKIGGACFDQAGEVEVWIREMRKDLVTLAKLRSSR
jgi:hypothetical protein